MCTDHITSFNTETAPDICSVSSINMSTSQLPKRLEKYFPRRLTEEVGSKCSLPLRQGPPESHFRTESKKRANLADFTVAF